VTAPEAPGFTQDLERLEQIVRRLENEALDLDDALRLFEEGVERLRVARERLSHAELRVRQVLGTQAGKLELGDIDR
jgi:exodeoxyribonuclease VII small subunit